MTNRVLSRYVCAVAIILYFFSSQHPDSWQHSTVMNEVYETCTIKIREEKHCTTHEYAVTVLLIASSFY